MGVSPLESKESLSHSSPVSLSTFMREVRVGRVGKKKKEENIIPYRPLCCVSAKDDCERVRKSGISTLDCVKVSLPRTGGWFCIYYGAEHRML